MKKSTFYDFRFRARHSMDGKSESAAHSHWHSYTVRLWFTGSPDQDRLSQEIESRSLHLHGADLNTRFADTSDEGIAEEFLKEWGGMGCFGVRVTNDERRGAEVFL